ncbi:ABC transporter [Colletotrichum costaricense]|nr:ABC transporter [Colletotrichum costaricense]KAK1536660.1 ABC transporter [Colletotrichum costaricense]
MAETLLGLEVAFYLYPCGLFVTLLAAQSFQFYRDRHGVTRQTATDDEQKKASRLYARIIWGFQLILSLLLLATIILAVHGAIAGQYDGTGEVVFPFSAYLASYVAVLLYYLAGLLPDPEGPWTPTSAHFYAWIVGALFEAFIAAVFSSEKNSFRVHHGLLDILDIVAAVRIVVLVAMMVCLILRDYKLKPLQPKSDPEERQSLLGNGNGNGNGASHNYGGAHPHGPAAHKPPARTQVSGTGWLDYFAGFRVLFPYLWYSDPAFNRFADFANLSRARPKDSPVYQGIVVVCIILLIGQRTINVLAPIQLGTLVDSLGYGTIPYKQIVLYVVYRALQGNQGILGAARSVLWIPVSQSLFRRLSCAAFEHVLGLSLEFHLNKKIGEVTSALSRGSAMNTFLENFCFQVFPMVFDIFVAGVVFFAKYDAFYTIIVFFIMWSYIFLTIYVAKYRGKQRRDMATKNREMEATKTDAIMAYETVQHNCAVVPETERFKEHVVVYQRAERLVQWSLNFLNLTQSSIFSLGTALLVAVSAYKISRGEQSVGDFVSLINYFVQLQGPLNFFGTYYTMLQNNLIEAERMLELFKETSGIVEKPDAVTLPAVKGEVAFNNVKFSYQSKKGEPAINGVSFTVAPGTKTAIVGESGSGKSTCLKLLFRFYDINEGSITVDGHDLKDLKLDSLRKNIGVVPQDTVLFNATIMYNLLYADRNASQADVYEACKAANIHDRILAFPDGYDTKVGERGLKLSGGERQRIAIARAILKDARILLLDEATASLDSHTERQIQDALERVTAGRTTITIAHRLSTITTSDQIVVLHKGNVVERGTHAELLALGGRYHAMWEKQTTIEKKNIEKVEKEGESSETASQQ